MVCKLLLQEMKTGGICGSKFSMPSLENRHLVIVEQDLPESQARTSSAIFAVYERVIVVIVIKIIIILILVLLLTVFVCNSTWIIVIVDVIFFIFFFIVRESQRIYDARDRCCCRGVGRRWIVRMRSTHVTV